ncbi:MAG TPA: choice-of-anchor D domain-containing protein, partial [Candidatus Kapabacteria bacterium]|nr:choice-of-anchor D domain-containing protein [Candidatus Kapabacteria bacterium]
MSTLVQTSILHARTRLFQFLLVLLAGVVLMPGSSRSQGVSSEGKEFWLGFMPNADLPSQALAIFVGTGAANRIKVDTYGDNGNIVRSQSITLGADQTHRFDMSVGLSETRIQEVPQYKAIRVTSTAPCVVYGYSDNQLSTDGYLALPISGYGKEYYCFSYVDDFYWFVAGSHLGGEFLVVAPYDATEVTITLPENATTSLSEDGKTIGHNGRDTWKVTLNKGQTYLVQTTGWNFGTDDLTGAKVTSTKPVAFLTGHQRAQIETTGDNSKDHLIEMIPPTDRWGTEYFMVPHTKRVYGDYIRVLSAEDNNTISTNGATRTINAGEWFEVNEQKAATTFTSLNGKKFMVMDYSYHQNYVGSAGTADPNLGDPHIITMIPKEQFQKRIIFRTPVNVGSGFNHYLTVIYHKDFIGQVTLKKGPNSPAPLSQFAVGGTINLPNSDYVAQVCKISGDELTWIAEAPTPMGIYQYGFTQTEGYGWPAGMALKILTPDPMAPLETRVEDCGDFDVELTETHLMPKDAWDDTKIAEAYMVTETGDPNWNKVSFNYVFDLADDFTVGATKTTYTLRVLDKTQDAYAAVYTFDQAGNDSLYEYFYEAAKLGVTPKPEYVFAPVLVDQDSCMEITLRNDQTQGDIEITKASIMGLAQAGSFTVTPTDINKVLKPGETLKLTICFNALDTLTYLDSLIVQTLCAPFKFALRGEGVIPKIFASDKYFGLVEPGLGPKCAPIQIENRGKYPLTIFAHNFTTNVPEFTLDPAELSRFPITIPAGGKIDLSFCFAPTDTGNYRVQVDYTTNIPARYKALDKNYSILTGISLKPGAKLSVIDKSFGPTNCIERPQYTDTLYNDGDLAMLVDSVTLIGPGAESFNIVKSIPADRVTTSFALDAGPEENPKLTGVQYVVEFDPNYAGTGTQLVEADLVAWTRQGVVPITHVTGSRIAPVLAVDVTAPIDLGNIKTNFTKTATFNVSNTGTAPLVVTNIVTQGTSTGKFTLNPTNFTLAPGAVQPVTVTFTPGTDVGNFSETFMVVTEKPNCTQDLPVSVMAASNENNYTAQGADYQTVFTCIDKELNDPSFTNFSSDQDITITDIQVVNANGWDDAGDFAVVDQLTAPIQVARNGGTIEVPVRFTPSATGVREAGLRFSFDLEGESKEIIVPLVGIGDVIPQIVAVGSTAGGQEYTATMNDELRIPIVLDQSFANRNANVRGYSFDISFKRDAFSFADDVAGPANVTVERISKGYDPATDMETFTVTTTGLSPAEITVDNYAAQLHLLPRVHPGLTTDITVRNAAWLDANNNVICYIPTEYRDAKYQFDPLCGDIALQE